MGFDPEMPHVGIEGFAPGDAQHHDPEDEKSMQAVVEKKLHGMPGIDCRQNLGVFGNGHEAQTRR